MEAERSVASSRTLWIKLGIALLVALVSVLTIATLEAQANQANTWLWFIRVLQLFVVVEAILLIIGVARLSKEAVRRLVFWIAQGVVFVLLAAVFVWFRQVATIPVIGLLVLIAAFQGVYVLGNLRDGRKPRFLLFSMETEEGLRPILSRLLVSAIQVIVLGVAIAILGSPLLVLGQRGLESGFVPTALMLLLLLLTYRIVIFLENLGGSGVVTLALWAAEGLILLGILLLVFAALGSPAFAGLASGSGMFFIIFWIVILWLLASLSFNDFFLPRLLRR